MSAHTIERDIEIDAPVDVVWRTITDPDQIRRWLCDSVEVEGSPGATGTLTFGGDGDGDGDPLVVDVAVVTVEAPHRYSFRWCSPPGVTPTPANSVLVTFTLTVAGPERTHLQVTETGLDDLDWPDDEKDAYVESHRQGWRERTAALQELFSSERG